MVALRMPGNSVSAFIFASDDSTRRGFSLYFSLLSEGSQRLARLPGAFSLFRQTTPVVSSTLSHFPPSYDLSRRHSRIPAP